jgi:Phospholipase_D-nuclease N-terminal
MDWTFGTFLWAMLVFFFWFTVIWVFVAVFADIFRQDMSGWAKAGWVILIVVLPFLGALIYLIARPKTALDASPMVGASRQERPAGRSAADEIAKAADLREQGRITTDEFERLKQQALSY